MSLTVELWMPIAEAIAPVRAAMPTNGARAGPQVLAGQGIEPGGVPGEAVHVAGAEADGRRVGNEHVVAADHRNRPEEGPGDARMRVARLLA